MTELQKKIELLQRIAQRLNEAHVQWALGASMLLYFKGITSAFHAIDLWLLTMTPNVSARFYWKWASSAHLTPVPESHVPDEDLCGIPHRIDRGRCHGRLCHRA